MNIKRSPWSNARDAVGTLVFHASLVFTLLVDPTPYAVLLRSRALEQRRGCGTLTLDFLTLTPESHSSMTLGKLTGVLLCKMGALTAQP